MARGHGAERDARGGLRALRGLGARRERELRARASTPRRGYRRDARVARTGGRARGDSRATGDGERRAQGGVGGGAEDGGGGARRASTTREGLRREDLPRHEARE